MYVLPVHGVGLKIYKRRRHLLDWRRRGMWGRGSQMPPTLCILEEMNAYEVVKSENVNYYTLHVFQFQASEYYEIIHPQVGRSA